MSVTAYRSGVATLPLHYGRAPAWLFARMQRLARSILVAVVEEFGPDEVLRRLADPFWFQALGCVLGYDWHSSGLTTTVCGAIKEGLRGLERELGLFIAGGKGKTSRRTPSELESYGALLGLDPSGAIYSSRMTAKVDNSALQDGYQLYHHSFFLSSSGSWAVVQQGMNGETGYARRYHWLGSTVGSFVCEPHAAICTERKGDTLNLVAKESSKARQIMSQVVVEEEPEKVLGRVARLRELDLPSRAHIALQDIRLDRLRRPLTLAYAYQPRDFQALLEVQGVGQRTLRALSLIAELIYEAPVSLRDPATFSFAHGGKDGHPYPVDRETYDSSIRFLSEALRRAKIGDSEKLAAFKRLKDNTAAEMT